ncbi:helix-turn-helix transcriptional regulator [Arthrobacter liuii]|uniref:HTH cro/C1-type domain-containing protein n=1 Tax=Arthrobacter liuii TaxID=1476996 RepID=A0ABQ2B1A7_9MICC|nr:helix-turn-helix transcriptional regulator [Arthrobacter liuii]GGI03138.1 hypothetical protein GCM10007170_46430 [Arthrobacter liuii]
MEFPHESQRKPATDEELLVALQANLQRELSEHRESMRESLLGLEAAMCDKFRRLREERGWSQQDVSEKLAGMGIDMHQTTVAKMEKGKRPLRVAEMYALSWVFGLPPGAVFWLPSSEGMPYSMKYMTEELSMIDGQQAEMREQFLKMFESHLALYADLDSRRASLLRAMKDAAAGNRVNSSQEDYFRDDPLSSGKDAVTQDVDYEA